MSESNRLCRCHKIVHTGTVGVNDAVLRRLDLNIKQLKGVRYKAESTLPVSVHIVRLEPFNNSIYFNISLLKNAHFPDYLWKKIDKNALNYSRIKDEISMDIKEFFHTRIKYINCGRCGYKLITNTMLENLKLLSKYATNPGLDSLTYLRECLVKHE